MGRLRRTQFLFNRRSAHGDAFGAVLEKSVIRNYCSEETGSIAEKNEQVTRGEFDQALLHCFPERRPFNMEETVVLSPCPKTIFHLYLFTFFRFVGA